MLRPALFVATLFALLPGAAWGSGLDIPDLGAAELASGSTGAASPTDATALTYNPAGLAQQKGFRALIDLRAVQEKLTFQRLNADGSNEDGWLPVSNAGGPTIAPMFGLSYALTRLPVPFTIALGGHPASGYTGLAFPDPLAIYPRDDSGSYRKGGTYAGEVAREAPQRYSLISNDSLVYTFDLGVAVCLMRKLDLGVTFRGQYAHFVSKQAIYGNPNTAGENAGWDADLAVDATSAFTPSATLGASYALPFGLAVGASFELPSDIHAHGTMTLTNGPALTVAKATQKGNQADLVVKFPWIARAGLKLSRPAFDLELDFTYDAWSRYDAIELDPHDVSIVSDSGTTKVQPSRLVKGLQDAQSLRFGGVFRPGTLASALSFLTVRAGVLGETSAVPSSYTALDQANWERLSASVGLGFALGGYQLVVAYAHFFQPDRQVRDSAVQQSAPNLPAADVSIVGNGDYHAQIDVADVSLSGAWGQY